MTEPTRSNDTNIGELEDLVYQLEGRIATLETEIYLLKENFTKALQQTQQHLIEILRADDYDDDGVGGISVGKWE